MSSGRLWVVVAVLAAGCPSAHPSASAADAAPDPADASQDAGGTTCAPCLISSDCGERAACVQYGSSDYCGKLCGADTDCEASERCARLVAFDGTAVSVCAPREGSCNGTGCGSCPPGSACDLTTGQCVPVASTPDGGQCGSWAAPEKAACCRACSNAQNCQPNGCYNGWWCDTDSCGCHAQPTNCDGAADGGVDLGPVDGGVAPAGSVGPEGGRVSRLYFAVVGDTRPANLDATAQYPTSVISRIYADIEAMDPRPEFVIATGDYIFATPTGAEGAPQFELYGAAARQYTGTLFAALGNHECTGYTAGNCTATSGSNNYAAYLRTLVTPLGKAQPYYSVPINATDGSWTAKLVVIACNAWDATQRTWLEAELAKPTTHTLVVRHEPSSATTAPCVPDTNTMLATAAYDLLIVGHTHTFTHHGKEIVVGNGGAPLSGGAAFGYALVEQVANGFVITEYDAASAKPIGRFTVP